MIIPRQLDIPLALVVVLPVQHKLCPDHLDLLAAGQAESSPQASLAVSMEFSSTLHLMISRASSASLACLTGCR